MPVSLDRIDFIILKNLLKDGRASFSSIAKQINLTDVAVKKRVESLKRKNVINSINATLNLKSLGYENPIYLQIRSEIGKNKDLFKKLNELDYIVELHQVLGEYNLLAKMVVTDLNTAEKAIAKLGLLDGIIDMKTLVVLSELKNGPILPNGALQKKL